MPPRSRRRAAAAREPRPAPRDDDEQFDDDLNGTVDLSGAEDDFDFESAVQSNDDDVDFESMVPSAGQVDYAEDVDFESEVESEGEFDDEEEPAPASRSRRGARASGRSGRSARSERLAGASERKKAAKSARKQARKEKTPEEIEASRRAMKNGLLLTLLMVGIIGAGIGFYYLVLRVPPERVEALNHLQAASAQRSTLDLLINGGDASEAEELINRVVADHLNLEMFGYAASELDPDNPSLIDINLARQAADLRQAFESRLPDIQRLRENRLAQANHDRMLARLSDLSPESEPDLNALRADVDAFMDNPAFPDRGPNLILAARYRNQFVLPVRNMVVEIERERARRIAAGTTDVVSAANQESDILMRDNRYGDALRLVDDLARTHPQANLGPVRQKILESARVAWQSDKVRANNAYRIASDPGSAAGDRRTAREQAREILHRVVTRYGEGVSGVDQYVQEAKQMQREFGF